MSPVQKNPTFSGGVREESREWIPAVAVNLKRSLEDTDYMRMSYEQRAFDTDKLKAPPGHIVTGVRMRNIGGHINLEAQVKSYVSMITCRRGST
jgi:hypothetical protein